jgi:hypothetical protein
MSGSGWSTTISDPQISRVEVNYTSGPSEYGTSCNIAGRYACMYVQGDQNSDDFQRLSLDNCLPPCPNAYIQPLVLFTLRLWPKIFNASGRLNNHFLHFSSLENREGISAACQHVPGHLSCPEAPPLSYSSRMPR